MKVVEVIAEMGDRTHAAWRAIEDRLDQEPDRWFTWDEITNIGFLGSDLKPASVGAMVSVLCRWGVLKRKHRKGRVNQGYRRAEGVRFTVRIWTGKQLEVEDLEKTNGAGR